VHDIFEAAQGVPRLINLICDRAMLAGYADQTRDIGPQHVKKAVLALRGEEAELRPAVSAPATQRRTRRAVAFQTATAVLVVAVLLGWWRLDAAQISDQSLYRDAAQAATPADAERLYTEFTTKFPASTYAPEAFLALAQLQLNRGDNASALASLKQASLHVQDGPEKSRIAVWTALADLATGDTVNACATLATTDSGAARDALLRPQIDAVASHCGGAPPATAESSPPDSMVGAHAHSKADSAAPHRPPTTSGRHP
jgi:hypothetical protein